MSNNHIIDEIQELLSLQAQDLHVSSIVFGDLEEPRYNNYSDCNFIESFQGHYILFKYLKNYNSNFDCKIFPRKGSIRKIISSKILNFIYQYEKDLYTLAEVNDFRILSTATFRTGIYVGGKWKLTLEAKGRLELLRSDRILTSHNIRDTPTIVQVQDAYPRSDRGDQSIYEGKIKEIEEDNQKKDREIARLKEQLTNISSQSRDTNELSQLRKERDNLRDTLSQMIQIAQSSMQVLSVTEESIDDTREYYSPERDSLQHNQEDVPIPALVDSFAPNEDQFLDPKTIEILNWYQKYRNNPGFLEKHTQQVSEIPDSFNARRSGASVAIVLAPAKNHSFLIYGDQYMFPRPDSKITNPKLNTFEACFECENFSSGASFEVLKPAIVSKLSVGDDRWQLEEKGKIQFY